MELAGSAEGEGEGPKKGVKKEVAAVDIGSLEVCFFFLFVVSRLTCARHGPYKSYERFIRWSAEVGNVPTGWVQILRGPRAKAEKWPAATGKGQETPSGGVMS